MVVQVFPILSENVWSVIGLSEWNIPIHLSTEIMCLILILKSVFLNNGEIGDPLCFESFPSFTCPIHGKCA